MSSEPDPQAGLRGLPLDPQRSPWQAAPGLRTAYRDELRQLDQEFVAIGERVAAWSAGLVLPVIDDRTEMPWNLEIPSNEDLERLAERASRLEDAAFTVMAREAPVAGDLRATIAIIRSTYDLLRAGRLVRHIVDGLDSLADHLGELGVARQADLRRLRDVAVEVFSGGVRSWRERDVLAVGELRSRDERAGELRDRLFAELPAGLGPECTVAYVLLCRYFERLGDHGVNLAAQLAWSVTGDRVAGHTALGGPSH